MQRKQIIQEKDILSNFQSLATAYEEISVMKMRQVRDSVVSTRSFLDGVQSVFEKVKSSYHDQIEELMKKNHSRNKQATEKVTFSTLENNGKTAVVLLSANAKLYGDIIGKTFHSFLTATTGKDVDIVIIGSLGKELFSQAEPSKQYTYFSLPDMHITMDDLKDFVSFIGQYQVVKMFYGKFENVVTQTPQENIVSGQEENTIEENTPKHTFKFFFEPSLSEILHFFETQVFSVLVKQTMHEHELARHASRITAMEQALTTMNKKMQKLNHMEILAKATVFQKKQQQAVAGIRLWNKKK